MAEEKTFKVFIEIPQGSSIKYEVDEETGELTVDRFLHTSFVYPFNYGFVKDTHAEDGDPVDVVILSTHSIAPGVTMKCKAIGILGMEDEEGIDNKVLVVPVKRVDPLYGAYEDIKDVPEALLNKIKHFFENYKTLEPNKWVKVTNYKGRVEAEEEIEKASK